MSLIPIKDVQLEGETIKYCFFLDVIGGDKMFMVMASGMVVILPVYRGCPVQEGALSDLVGDFPEYRGKLRETLLAQTEDVQSLEAKLEEIEDGMD